MPIPLNGYEKDKYRKNSDGSVTRIFTDVDLAGNYFINDQTVKDRDKYEGPAPLGVD